MKGQSRIFYFIIGISTMVTTAISFGGCAGATSSPVLQTPAPSSSPLLPSLVDQFVVCLDPGHPSENNTGDVLQNGLKEVEINWQVAKRLEKILDTQGIRVVMTKNAVEQYVDNQTRARIANQAAANLLVRLHCDSGSGRNQGITFYYPDRQGTKDGKTGPSTKIIEKSKFAAGVVHAKTVAILAGALKDNGVKGESATLIGSQQGALTGSIYSEVPVITVEMVFLDYPSDAQFIRAESGRQKMAEALKEGILASLTQ